MNYVGENLVHLLLARSKSVGYMTTSKEFFRRWRTKNCNDRVMTDRSSMVLGDSLKL